eukprot:scaffold1181_cov387-Prasinococcus_capsulatus_cf.AAC.14
MARRRIGYTYHRSVQASPAAFTRRLASPQPDRHLLRAPSAEATPGTSRWAPGAPARCLLRRLRLLLLLLLLLLQMARMRPGDDASPAPRAAEDRVGWS